MSAESSLAVLNDTLPRFEMLRRAVSWPLPVARILVGRWLRPFAPETAADAVHVERIVGALRSLRLDDRSFCRAVHLEGWPQVADADEARFELTNRWSDLVWIVAVRALILFGGAGPSGRRSIRPPSPWPDDAGWTELSIRRSAERARHRFLVRTLAEDDGSFRVVVEH